MQTCSKKHSRTLRGRMRQYHPVQMLRRLRKLNQTSRQKTRRRRKKLPLPQPPSQHLQPLIRQGTMKTLLLLQRRRNPKLQAMTRTSLTWPRRLRPSKLRTRRRRLDRLYCRTASHLIELFIARVVVECISSRSPQIFERSMWH